MGGWFHTEIKSVDDLGPGTDAGIAGKVLPPACALLIAGGAHYPALVGHHRRRRMGIL
jgi:TRAP-type mannitol/chloroaromatic compound transport system substrate-binding protein